MGFLKRLGQIALQLTTGINTFGPIVKQFTNDKDDARIDRLTDKVKEFTDVVIAIEAVGQVAGLDGPAKMRAAAPLIAQVVLKSDFMAGKKIADATLFQQGCQRIGSGFADVLNSLKENEGVETHSFT